MNKRAYNCTLLIRKQFQYDTSRSVRLVFSSLTIFPFKVCHYTYARCLHFASRYTLSPLHPPLPPEGWHLWTASLNSLVPRVPVRFSQLKHWQEMGGQKEGGVGELIPPDHTFWQWLGFMSPTLLKLQSSQVLLLLSFAPLCVELVISFHTC